jgi:glyoxylase-like metal-dependent hydrolase (beta-lactamase superfamily II)
MLRRTNIHSASLIALVTALALAACSKTAEAPKEEAAAPASPPVAEAAPAPASDNVKVFKIGDLSAMALRDGGMELPNDNKVLGVGRTPEEVAAVLSAAGQPTDKLALSIQPLLVKTTDRVLLFDTGAGANFGPGAGKLQGSLAEAGVDPQSVTDIFISHAHGDHVGGLLKADGTLAFPNAAIHLSAPEWKFMSGLTPEKAKSMGIENYAAQIATIKTKVAEFAPDSELIPGTVKAVGIKGHTPGHSGYLITSGAGSLLYVGDSMHHFVVSVQKPEWTIAFDSDAPTAQKSRAELIASSAANGQRIYAVHFPFPGLGKFEKQGDHFVWVAE